LSHSFCFCIHLPFRFSSWVTTPFRDSLCVVADKTISDAEWAFPAFGLRRLEELGSSGLFFPQECIHYSLELDLGRWIICMCRTQTLLQLFSPVGLSQINR
jgi:hypothetical protein